MTGEQHFVVEEYEVGQRLDQLLARRLSISRNQVQHRIKQRQVVVRGKEEPAHYRVRIRDQIDVVHTEPQTDAGTAVLTPTVVAAANDYVVLDKPAGLLVHPVEGKKEYTLVDWLTSQYPEVHIVGNLLRPGIVHRLDRLVSGLLVVARTPEMFDHLAAQFKTHQILKIYTALVYGAPLQDTGTLNFAIRRSARHPARMAALPATAEGKTAVTKFNVIERFRTTALLSVRILTGRPHQIRAHLFAAGHPVVGDSLYRPKKTANLPPLDRLFLHAAKLGFSDRSGEWQEFTSALPDTLTRYLAALHK